MPMGGMGPMGPMPMPIGSMAGSAYGTPYHNNALMMGGMGSEYGAPLVDGYPPTIARTHSLHTPSLYGDDRDLYDRDRGYYDRGYSRDYYDDGYDRGRRYYDDDYSRRRGRSYSRSSRRSRGDYYDDPYDYEYSRGYGSDYYDRDRYDRYSSRYRSSSGYYPSSSRYYSSGSRSGRKREELSVIKKDNGDIKVLRDGQERFGDKFRRMFGLDPKGMNIVRVKRGEQLAAHISR